MEKAVGLFRGVFGHLFVGVGLRRVPLKKREHLRLYLAAAPLQAVHEETEGVHAGAESVVLGAELLAGRAAEPVRNSLGLRLQAQKDHKYADRQFSDFQKLKPILNPIAGIWPEVLNASWLLSGIMTVGDMFIERSSVTSKLCM